MADIARDVPVPGRAAVPAVLRPAAGACGVILMHGSGGGMDSGRLPLYTDALADAGFSVLRFTIKPPSMPTRIKCCQVRCISAPWSLNLFGCTCTQTVPRHCSLASGGMTPAWGRKCESYGQQRSHCVGI